MFKFLKHFWNFPQLCNICTNKPDCHSNSVWLSKYISACAGEKTIITIIWIKLQIRTHREFEMCSSVILAIILQQLLVINTTVAIPNCPQLPNCSCSWNSGRLVIFKFTDIIFCILYHMKVEKIPIFLTGVALLWSQWASSSPSSASVHCGYGAGAGGGGEQHPRDVDEGALQQVPHDQLEKDGSDWVHGADYSGQLFLPNVTIAEPQP